MRVLHVAEVTHGGVISLIDTYAHAQVSRGDDVHVLAPPAAQDLPGTRHAWDPVRSSPGSLAAAERRLRRLVLDIDPDVVHLHSFVPGLLGRARALPTAAAVVYQPHSFAFDAVPAWGVRTIAALEHQAIRHTDRLVTNCEDEREEGCRHGIDMPTSVVGVPVDTTHFAPAHGAAPRSPETVGLRNDFTAVCVGRLCHQKGQRRLAEAWEAAPPSGGQLVFVGPGDPEEIARAAPTTFGSSIIVAGPQADVRPWLWAASIGIQPSLYEGQSVAMAEALCCGVPLVMTDVNGAREAIAPAGEPAAGAVVGVNDIPGLLREVERRRQSPDLRAQEAAAARKRALRLFALDRVMDRVERAYSEALSAASRRTASTVVAARAKRSAG